MFTVVEINLISIVGDSIDAVRIDRNADVFQMKRVFCTIHVHQTFVQLSVDMLADIWPAGVGAVRKAVDQRVRRNPEHVVGDRGIGLKDRIGHPACKCGTQYELCRSRIITPLDVAVRRLDSLRRVVSDHRRGDVYR